MSKNHQSIVGTQAKYENTGQVRSGLHASGEPVLGRRRKKHNMYTTAVYMRQKLTNEGKCEFHTTSSTSLHDPRLAYLQYAWSLDTQNTKNTNEHVKATK